MDALKLGDPVLAGHSFGGQDLNFLGTTHPDRMAGLVYLSSADDTSPSPKLKPPDSSQLPKALHRAAEPDKNSFTAFREWQKKSSLLNEADVLRELRALLAKAAR